MVAEWLPVDWHLFVIVISFIILDFITGVVAAIKNGELGSTPMRVGLLHKLGYILAIVLGIICDFGAAYIDLHIPFDVTILIIGAICITEIVSIIENIALIVPEFESVLKSIFGKKTEPDEKKIIIEKEEVK